MVVDFAQRLLMADDSVVAARQFVRLPSGTGARGEGGRSSRRADRAVIESIFGATQPCPCHFPGRAPCNSLTGVLGKYQRAPGCPLVGREGSQRSYPPPPLHFPRHAHLACFQPATAP
jgi:hypothetical protein